MKKIAPAITLIYLITIPSIFAQIKTFIPIVKPVQYEKTKETFENIAKKFEQRNYNDLAEIFRSFAQGGHGSGFVYVDTDGENYIITNRHVIASSESANLEFTGKGSTKIVYESCPIVYSDDDIDLAIIKFPNNEKVYDKSFTINTTKQTDGEEIWSAGFPGLLGKPMWQFAKGNITNEEAYVDQLVNPDVTYLIQHSASIDPGNSGGPLVIKEGTGVEGYSVIGINTWTITNRQNTFFAIPSKNLPALITKTKKTITLQKSQDSLRLELIRQCELFAAEINSDKPKWDHVMNNISYSFVGYKGWDSFLQMLSESDAETLKQLESRFFNYSPIEAMRYSILHQLWKRIYTVKEKLSTVAYKGINIADEIQFAKSKPVRTIFLINGDEQEIEWIFEHGHWRISHYDFDKYSKNKQNSDYTASEYHKPKRHDTDAYFGFSVFVSPYSYFSDETLNNNFALKGFGGSINFSVKKLKVFVRANSLSLNNKMKNPPSTVTEASAQFLQISHGIQINFLNTKLSPYFLVALNYTKFTESGAYKSFSTSHNFEFLGAQLGLGIRYKINRKWGIFCEGSYYTDTLTPSILDEGTSTTYTENLGNFQAFAGISFDLRKNEKK